MFCTNCGKEIDDKAVVCVHCGCATETQKKEDSDKSTLRTVALIFMIIGCVGLASTIIGLFWSIPMTIHYYKACQENRKCGIAFKVCSLIFVSLIAGVLMLIDENN